MQLKMHLVGLYLLYCSRHYIFARSITILKLTPVNLKTVLPNQSCQTVHWGSHDKSWYLVGKMIFVWKMLNTDLWNKITVNNGVTCCVEIDFHFSILGFLIQGAIQTTASNALAKDEGLKHRGCMPVSGLVIQPAG